MSGLEEKKFTTRDLVAVVLWTVSIVGLYYGLSAKIDGNGAVIKQQTQVIEQQAKTISALQDRVAAAESQLRAQDHSLNELTTTLRVMRVIR